MIVMGWGVGGKQGLDPEEHGWLADGLQKRVPIRGRRDRIECSGESQSQGVAEARRGESDRMGGA